MDQLEADVRGLAASGERYGGVLDKLPRVIELYRADPGAKHDGVPLRNELQDLASELDNVEPDLAAQIDRTLR